MASGRDQLDGPASADDPEPAREGAFDAASEQASTPAPRPRSRVAWHAGVVLVFALAGALFLTARDTANGQGDIRPDRGAQLSDVIRAQNAHNQRLTEQVADQRANQDALTRAQSADARVKAVQEQIDALAAPVALTPVTGSALTVTLNDAQQNPQPAAGAPSAQPDWLIIHQQDVQAVVNALWAGGATGIQLMDQRLGPTSAVRCVGNTLLLQGRVYSPPYVITAVGDPAKMRSALLAAPAVQTYLEYVSAYGLGWDVRARDRVTLPGYSGPLDVSFASPAP